MRLLLCEWYRSCSKSCACRTRSLVEQFLADDGLGCHAKSTYRPQEGGALNSVTSLLPQSPLHSSNLPCDFNFMQEGVISLTRGRLQWGSFSLFRLRGRAPEAAMIPGGLLRCFGEPSLVETAPNPFTALSNHRGSPRGVCG